MSRARVPAVIVLCVFLMGGAYLAQEQMEGQPPPQQQPPQREPAPIPPPPDGVEGFGHVNWGMTPDEVAGLVPDGSRGESGGIRVKMSVAGKPSQTYFVFRENKLAVISGTFTERYNRLNDYVHEYNRIKRILTEYLGAPVYDEEVWEEDGLPQDELEVGRAVATGRLRLATWWETDKSYVELRCRGGNYEVTRTFRFQSREFGGSPRRPPTRGDS